MKSLKILSLIHAFLIVVYVTAVVCTIGSIEHLFDNRIVMAPIIFLSLFVLSAAVTGALVLGKPILLYLEGHKKDAVRMFLYTIGWLLILIMLVIIGNLMTY